MFMAGTRGLNLGVWIGVPAQGIALFFSMFTSYLASSIIMCSNPNSDNVWFW
jgi:hypothetical protein